MHSKNMKVSQGELTSYIADMVALLQDPTLLHNHADAIQAVIDIRKVLPNTTKMSYAVH